MYSNDLRLKMNEIEVSQKIIFIRGGKSEEEMAARMINNFFASLSLRAVQFSSLLISSVHPILVVLRYSPKKFRSFAIQINCITFQISGGPKKRRKKPRN